jgi:endonuclease YncB( thermonuclease family)
MRRQFISKAQCVFMRPLLLTLLLLLPLVAATQSSGTAAELPVYYQVTRVVDGDTFWIDDGSEKGLKIRLIGVDAPSRVTTGRS